METEDINSRAVIFRKNIQQLMEKQGQRGILFDEKKLSSLIGEVKVAKTKTSGKTPKDYRRLSSYDVIEVRGEEHLVSRKRSEIDSILYFTSVEKMFDILDKCHTELGHRRTLIMFKQLSNKYANITRDAIDLFNKLCQQCQLKKKSHSKGIVVKPILTKDFNERCQVDLIDMQSVADGEFRFILNYQDHMTKFCVLRAIKRKTAEAVVEQLVEIFCFLGAPKILQSDNGREFANSLVMELKTQWPGLMIVRGKPRHSQSQGSVERANQDVRDLITSQLADEKSKSWASVLKFVQFKKNSSYHQGIKMTPFQAMFGSTRSSFGLKDSNLPEQSLLAIGTEEELEELVTSSYKQHAEQDQENIVPGIAPTTTTITESDNEENSGISCQVNDVNCFVCELSFGTGEISAHCDICSVIIHDDCSLDTEIPLCSLCFQHSSRTKNRKRAGENLEEQASKMLRLSAKKFKDVAVGSNVLIKIPEVDRSRITPRNVLGVVIHHDTEMQLYKLGTASGLLEKLYCRNEFILAETDFLSIEDVPKNPISLRTAAGKESGNTQGFTFCSCKKGCKTGTCQCKKNRLQCNSKCHSALPCHNK